MRLADSPSHPPGHIIFLGTGRVGVNRHRGHFGMTQPFLHQMKRNGFNPAFFEKKHPKTFCPASGGNIGFNARRTESLFASFSSEKEALPCSA
jgi:hypothetical protein